MNVPPGQTCELSDATILGNVTVQMAASVTFENSGTVGGNLLLGQLAGSSEGSDWIISGAAAANHGASMTFQGTVHGILANATQTLAMSSATVDGSVISNRGVFGGGITASVITGDLVINATTGDPAVAGDWFIGQLGGPINSAGGIGNIVDGRSTGQCATANPVGAAAANAASAQAVGAL